GGGSGSEAGGATRRRRRGAEPSRPRAPPRSPGSGPRRSCRRRSTSPRTRPGGARRRRVLVSAAIVSAAMWRVSVALVAVLLSGCGFEFGGGRGATRQGRDIFGLWQGSVIVAIFVGGLVWGLIVFAILRYRRRNDDLPNQVQYFVKLEILYTVVPVLIVAALFAFSYRTQNKVDALTKDPTVTIDVRGFQWQCEVHRRKRDGPAPGTPPK